MNNKSREMSVFINPVGSYQISMGYRLYDRYDIMIQTGRLEL